MADFGSPIAQDVNVNPGQGIATLQGLLGIKQQQLQLEQQAQQLISQQSAATQALIHTQNLQGLQSVNWKQFDTPDGYDIQSAQAKAQEVGGADAPDFISRLGTMTQNSTAAKQALFALNQQYQGPVRAIAQTWGAGDTDESDLMLRLGQYADTLPKEAQGQVRDIIRTSQAALDSPDPLTGVARTLAQKRQLAIGFGRAGLSTSEASDLAAPATGAQYDKSGNLVGTAQSKLTGEITQAPGAGMKVGLAPTQQPGYVGTISGITGQASVDTDRYSKVLGAAAQSQTGIALSDEVSALADQVRTGKLSKEWADRLAVLQQGNPQITARQMLGKFAAQLQTLAEESATTDQERSQIISGMPDPNTMDPQAVRQAAQYLHGYFRMAQDRGANALQYTRKSGVLGLAANDTQFTSGRDPFVYAFRDMPRDQQKQFLIQRFGAGKSTGLDQFEREVNGP